MNRQFPKEAMNMHMKRCSTALIIREMKSNLRRFHYTPPRMANKTMANKTDETNVCERMEQMELPTGRQNSPTNVEKSLAISYKANLQLPYNPAMPP